MPCQLIAAPHTPFHSDGALHLDAVDGQARLLKQSGVEGVFIGGSTGEYASLTGAERKQLAERWAQVANGLKVIVHVGCNAQPDAVELARHAASLPVQGIAALAPSYFRPAVEPLATFLAPVAAAAPDLPFYFYDIPSMTGVSIATVDFMRAAERIPSFRGVKFTNPDLAQFQECRQFEDGRFEILFGNDEFLLAGYALGASGAVGSTYNFAPRLYQQMIAAWDRGELEEARRLQYDSVRLVRILQSYGYMGAAKSLMALCGVDCGPVRPPLRPLSAVEQSQLRDRLAAAQLSQYLSGS